jgi:hypothetical protein
MCLAFGPLRHFKTLLIDLVTEAYLACEKR